MPFSCISLVSNVFSTKLLMNEVIVFIAMNAVGAPTTEGG